MEGAFTDSANLVPRPDRATIIADSNKYAKRIEGALSEDNQNDATRSVRTNGK